MLIAQNISKSFQNNNNNKQSVIHNVSFEIKKSQFYSIKGPSGSGKSTLLHIMGGLEQADSGDIIYNDKNLKDFSQKDWLHFRRFEVSFIFQFFHLFPRLTVLENVILPVQIAGLKHNQFEERAYDLLKKIHLDHKAKQNAQTLSGGEMQRVSIARALINSPKIILADEPTGNLDSKNAKNILQILSDLQHSENISLCLVTHDESVFQQATHRFQLIDGILTKT